MNFEQFAATYSNRIKNMKLTPDQRVELLAILKIGYETTNYDYRKIIWEDPEIDPEAAIKQLQDFFETTM